MTAVTYGALSIDSTPLPTRKTFPEVIRTFCTLGLISFGGTAANLGLFRNILITEEYITQDEFTELFSLAQCLPGPNASKVLVNGVITGTGKVYLGVIVFVMYATPSFLMLTTLGCLVRSSVDGNANENVFDSPMFKTVQHFVGLAAISVICCAAYDISA
jgi:chromate transport protein ChrA